MLQAAPPLSSPRTVGISRITAHLFVPTLTTGSCSIVMAIAAVLPNRKNH